MKMLKNMALVLAVSAIAVAATLPAYAQGSAPRVTTPTTDGARTNMDAVKKQTDDERRRLQEEEAKKADEAAKKKAATGK